MNNLIHNKKKLLEKQVEENQANKVDLLYLRQAQKTDTQKEKETETAIQLEEKTKTIANTNTKRKNIPLKHAYYIVGFSDGEGSFNISFKKRDDFLIGWKITASFNISQKEKLPLTFIKKHLGCGTIRFRKDSVWVYQVTNRTSLITQIIPFFETYSSISSWKKTSFNCFKKIVFLLDKHNGLFLKKDLELLIQLRNQGSPYSLSKRTYSDDFILERYDTFFLKNHKKLLEKI